MRITTAYLHWLLFFPSLVSAEAVSPLVFRGGSANRLDQGSNALVPDLGQDILQEKKLNTNSAVDEKYLERIVQSQWEKHRRWRAVAKKRKFKVDASRISKLVLVSFGAVAQVGSTQLDKYASLSKYKSTASLLGSVCIAAAGLIKNKILTDKEIHHMVTSYATSQAIKAEVYKFRANVKPYSQFKMNPDEALNLLRSRCSSISESTSDEKFYLTRQDSSPPPGWLNTVDQYMEKRIDDMINRFYVKRGRRLKQRAAFCSRCENVLLALSGAASFCSAQQLSGPLQKAFSTVGGWGGAFTTVSAAFANHIAKEKFNDIAVEYFEAAAKLQDVKDSWPPTAAMSGSPDWEEQVAKSENVILTTIEEWAKAKTGNEDLHLKAAPPVKKDPVWNPDVICGTDESGFYPASDRAEWLVTNKNMTQADAQKKVMVEFPERF